MSEREERAGSEIRD